MDMDPKGSHGKMNQNDNSPIFKVDAKKRFEKKYPS
jgi:hypothetical protein